MPDDTALSEVAAILEMVKANPAKAADMLDDVAARIKAHAATIRAGAAAESPFRVPGGMTDRLKMNVIGPDGTIKQSIDTKGH